jgi:hypothetical protein
MITVDPIDIRGAMVTSSTVPYPDTGETAWSGAAVAYTLGQTVSYLVGTDYYRFECIAAHTSSATNFPVPKPNETVNWLDLGFVNKFAMFQLERNTQTIETSSPLVVEVDPGDRVGVIGLGNLEADSVQLDIYDSGGTLVSTATKDLIDRYVASWYSYFYQPFRQIVNTLFSDIAIDATYTFKLTFTKATGSVKVGSVVCGMPYDIGSAQYRAKVRRLNFSTFDRAFDGETTIKIRRNVPKVNIDLIIDKPALNGVVRLIDDLNGVVTLWAGLVTTTDGYFESVFLIGIYKDIEYSLDYPNHAVGSIEIEAL